MFCALALAVLAAQEKPLMADEKREIAGLVAELVREPDPAKRRALAAKGVAYEREHAFADLVLAVRAGPLRPDDPLAPRKVSGREEKLSTFGRRVVGFEFQHGGDVYRYALDCPDGLERGKPRALLVDPGHGSGARADDEGKADFLDMFRRHADEAGHADWLVARTEILEQIGADGLRGALPEDRVVEVFEAFFREVATRFPVDLDRIYLTGLSQTGFWAWYLGRTRAERLAGIAPMSAVTWEVDRALENLLRLPAFVLHGADDQVCPVVQPRATCARLLALGAPVSYREIDGAGHDYGTWQHLPDGLRWLGERARERYPARVSKALQSVSDGGSAWIRVEAIEEEGDGKAGTPPTAGIDGEIEGQEVRLFSTGVERVTLALSSELLDLDRPITVTWNGKRVHEGKPGRSFAKLLEIVGERGDWLAVAEAALTLDAP